MKSSEIIVENDPKSPISEIFRNLRTNIQFMNTKGKLKSILLTSTLPGEGKSWVSSNLAVTFAQAGKIVCLIDADMRKGRQHKIFDCTRVPGLSNYLSGYYNGFEDKDRYLANYLQETNVKNLFLIPAGSVPPNPAELLISDSMVQLLDQLGAICDVIIIDGPPSQLVTDSIIMSRLVDSTVIVVESKKTKKDNLREIVNNIKNVGGNIAGVVINKSEVSSKKYEYSYYYGSTGDRHQRASDDNEGIYRVDELLHRDAVKRETFEREVVAYKEKAEKDAEKARRTEEIRKKLEDDAIRREQEKEIEVARMKKEEEERKEQERLEKEEKAKKVETIRDQIKAKDPIYPEAFAVEDTEIKIDTTKKEEPVMDIPVVSKAKDYSYDDDEDFEAQFLKELEDKKASMKKDAEDKLNEEEREKANEVLSQINSYLSRGNSLNE